MEIAIFILISVTTLGIITLYIWAKQPSTTSKRYRKIVNSHKYTQKEYIELYNYCITIRNSFLNNRFDGICRDIKINKWDKVLNYCKIEYEQNYYKPNYDNLCGDLLNLLYEENYSLEKINFGIIDKTLDK